jgi:glycosyltransferase involved in cell wall biosynthesis
MNSKAASSHQGLVSVIIPSYNHVHYVSEAIGSVLTQSYQDLEVLVIDDGSEDGSPELIAQMDDNRLTLVVQQNQGAHAAINRGLQMAKGEYLAILNSDDVYHPKRLENAIEAFRRDNGVELISTWIDVIDMSGRIVATKKGWENLEPWPLIHPELSRARLGFFAQSRGNQHLSANIGTTAQVSSS